MAISVLAANLTLVVSESVLYGIFLVLFCVGFYSRISRSKSESRFGTFWWLSTLAIFLTCTGHWIITVIRLFHAFLQWPPTDVASAYRAFNWGILQKVSSILSVTPMWIGDGVIIHRLWVVWNNDRRIIVLPMLSLVGLIGEFHFLDEALTFNDDFDEPANPRVYTHSFKPRGSANPPPLQVGYSAYTNVYCTAFIAWRVWGVRRAPQETEFKPLMSVLAIIMESAAIVAAWTIFYAITNETDSNLVLIAMNLTPQIIGISNMLIHIRIGITRASRMRLSDDTGVSMTSPASIIHGVTFPTSRSVGTIEPPTIKESEP
ncbi:hypothetical protein GGX14DRAFT_546998 [Mycena pura]|uniref:Uncharacterized protein n=1 Tax=Mycena pura TaxID=153505 RepID=A0AAD6UL15_9AGAR|nr:hypothetical protein GGX14DRAFT_546998 [Mycena pura]